MPTSPDMPARPLHHGTEPIVIEGEASARALAATSTTTPPFRFSRIGPVGATFGAPLLRKVAEAMTSGPRTASRIAAGYTYLGQFVDHDLTFDKTTVQLGTTVSASDLLQGRSPALNLDNLYGAGPHDPVSAEFYSDDRHLKIGTTTRLGADQARAGFDLPRRGTGDATSKRRAQIPDLRNDENLVVAAHHLAMIRFHNRVVDTLPASVPAHQRFTRARARVTMHYQWMLRTDYLPKVCDPAVVNDVFTNGRKIFEVGVAPTTVPTMPVEFSVAAFRLGHSMVRDIYDWNARFPAGSADLGLLFTFTGTSGDLGGNPTLPSNWIADLRRFYRFTNIDKPGLKAPAGVNNAMRIDTSLSNPLAFLPAGSFGGQPSEEFTIHANLAFRNLTRASMVKLASGQAMAAFLRNHGVPVTTLTKAQLRDGSGGAVLDALTPSQRDQFLAHTPLWFYVLREAELNNGHLTGVGARIVVETFHRAMEGSSSSIVRNPAWRPNLGPGKATGRFTMPDLLCVAFEGKKALLAPLGD